jgi:hypothetical protein
MTASSVGMAGVGISVAAVGFVTGEDSTTGAAGSVAAAEVLETGTSPLAPWLLDPTAAAPPSPPVGFVPAWSLPVGELFISD